MSCHCPKLTTHSEWLAEAGYPSPNAGDPPNEIPEPHEPEIEPDVPPETSPEPSPEIAPTEQPEIRPATPGRPEISPDPSLRNAFEPQTVL
jgi:hypothetical protein